MNTDYTNRSVDLLVFQQPTGSPAVDLGLGDSGEVITGIRKLAQSFCVLLLTEIGTIQAHPTWGSSLIAAARLGKLNSGDAVQTEFLLAVESVRAVLLSEAAKYKLPDDEIFSSATLLNFNLDQLSGKLLLTIKIESRLGNSRVVIAPVSYSIV